MSNAWDHAKGIADRHTGSGGNLFVRLANSGDKIVGIFAGKPYPREVHWTGERYEECAGEGCAHCAEGKKPSLRVALNFYVTADRELKVMEGSAGWFRQVWAVRTKYGLETWSFEVERHGGANDTRTTYTIMPETRLTDEQRDEIAKLELHDLPRVVGGGGESFGSYDRANDCAVIARDLADDLIARLRGLPRSAVDTFLEKLSIQKVRELKQADEKAAIELISSLESEHAPPVGGEDVDPFA